VQDLIILGTGVHAAEMAHIVTRINAIRPTWNLLGHIASGEATDATEVYGQPVLGPPEMLAHYPGACFVPDNAFPADVLVPPDRLVSLVDPSCFVHPTATVGEGCVLYSGCFIGVSARLAQRVFALANAAINHNGVIGDRAVLATGATVAGGVTVEPDCYLGQGCLVRQHLRIGRHSLVGMGAVVVADVTPDSVMVGNPARRLRSNTE